jgi:hypothetical protein
MQMLQASEPITVADAFDAIGPFLEAVRRRHNVTAEALDFVIGGLKCADGSPADPSMWEDWVAAASQARWGSRE